MSAPRPIRIPRSPGAARPAPAAPAVPPRGPSDPPTERRVNRGGVQRAQRLAVLYVAVLLLAYGGLVAYDRGTSLGASPGATGDLLFLGEVALGLAIVGALVALSSAPRAVELSPERTRIIGFLGRVGQFPAIGEFSVRIVHRHPASFLASTPTVTYSLSSRGFRRTYLLEEDLIPVGGPERDDR